MTKKRIINPNLFLISQHIFGILLILGISTFIAYFLFFKTYIANKTLLSNKPYVVTYLKVLTPTATPTPIPTYVAPQQQSSQDTSPWGVATHIGGPLWQIKLGADSRMGNAQEIFVALNNYRQVHNVGQLQWDDTLANYALQRAQTYTSLGKLDNHAGFNNFVTNQDGFKKLGYMALGENGALLNEPLLGVHIIEWLFAADPDHNANQLDPRWSNVGIGVDGYAVDVIFGGSKF